jgi:hypothetical protein
VQDDQSGQTTDEAKEAADKVAADQAMEADQATEAELAKEAELAQARSQQAFFVELARRERAAVRSFDAFLEALPMAVHLPEPAESKRIETRTALRALDEMLCLGLQMIGAPDVA